MDGIDFFFRGLIGIVIIFLGLSGWMVIACLNADATCARHGYPNSSINMDGWYCVRIVNQTSEIVKLPTD